MAETAIPLQLKGTAPVEEWKKRIQVASNHIHERDKALKKQRDALKSKRNMAIGVAALVGAGLGFTIHPVAGIFAFIAGAIAAFFIFKPPPADFIGEERVNFVRELVALLGDISPGSPLQLAAQLDGRQAVPSAELPGGFSDVTVARDKKEDWLSGSLAAIPGLRLAWQVTEWRSVKLVRKKVQGARKTKIKTKAKFKLATRLAVRLDVDRALFALKPVANPQRAQDGESQVEVRERPGGWSLRGRRDLVQKTPLWCADLVSGLATLREQGKAEFFGQPAASLINLMKLCEGRLLPAAQPAAAAGGTK